MLLDERAGVQQNKHTTPDTTTQLKSGDRGETRRTLAGEHYPLAGRGGSSRYYMPASLLITVRQAATNELISIF